MNKFLIKKDIMDMVKYEQECISVQELIDKLMEVSDKSLKIYGYDLEEGKRIPIVDVDTSVVGYVDVNMMY